MKRDKVMDSVIDYLIELYDSKSWMVTTWPYEPGYMHVYMKDMVDKTGYCRATLQKRLDRLVGDDILRIQWTHHGMTYNIEDMRFLKVYRFYRRKLENEISQKDGN